MKNLKNKFFFLTLTILSFGIFPNNGNADEIWTTEEYNVIYQEDRNNTAIWTYNNGLGTIFIDGLAGNFTNRESYNGYWVQKSSSLRCDTYREGANGQPSYYWGRFEITFIDSDFPSRWQGKFGLCDRQPVIILNGIPLIP